MFFERVKDAVFEVEDLRQALGDRVDLLLEGDEAPGDIELAPFLQAILEVRGRRGKIFTVEVVSSDLAQRLQGAELGDLGREGRSAYFR